MLFSPPPLLRNRHLQSILASSKLRKPFIKKSGKPMLDATKEVLLACGNGVQLHSLVSVHPKSSPLKKNSLVVLIHGWEGSAESTYLLSAATTLFNQGHDVVRLHLRDHGPSHHLNSGVFHGARIDEVVAAIQSINTLLPRQNTYLAGFSLGGNFALRVAAHKQHKELKLDKVVAISPVVNPPQTMKALESGASFYRVYFMRKWRKSLQLKHKYFPDKIDLTTINKASNLLSLTQMLVNQHTEFTSVEEYFNSYALTGNVLSQIGIPTQIITSQDDPVIPAKGFKAISASPSLNISVQSHGGHCGFIKDYRLNSWINDVLIDQFKISGHD